MAVCKTYRISEKTSVTENGPVVTREYRFGDNEYKGDSLAFIYQAWTDGYLPQLGDPYNETDEIYVQSVQAARIGSDKEDDQTDGTLYLWKAVVEWKPPKELENLWDEENDVFNVSITGESVDMDGRYDFDGHPNKNSIGEFYTDRLPITHPVIVVRMTVKQSTPPPINLIKKTNSGTFWQGGTDCWLCRNITGQFKREHQNGIYIGYWVNTYEMAYNADTWKLVKANAGYYHIEDGQVKRNLMSSGEPHELPQLLNQDGSLRTDGGYTPISFRVYQQADFSNLPLPDPFH